MQLVSQNLKPTRVVLKAAVETKDELDKILERFQFTKSMRITAWMKRFVKNCQNSRKNRQMGPLNTEEVRQATKFLIRRDNQKLRTLISLKKRNSNLV